LSDRPAFDLSCESTSVDSYKTVKRDVYDGLNRMVPDLDNIGKFLRDPLMFICDVRFARPITRNLKTVSLACMECAVQYTLSFGNIKL
jgi:hypothetical protein